MTDQRWEEIKQLVRDNMIQDEDMGEWMGYTDSLREQVAEMKEDLDKFHHGT